MSETEGSGELDEVLFNFLDKQPITIRDSLLYLCGFGMGLDCIRLIAGGNLLEQLREKTDVPRTSVPYVCAQIIGVLELVLEQMDRDTERTNWAIYEKTGIEQFQKVAMQQPLMNRHWQAAREEFHQLRQTSLSTQSLCIWQRRLETSYHFGSDD